MTKTYQGFVLFCFVLFCFVYRGLPTGNLCITWELVRNAGSLHTVPLSQLLHFHMIPRQLMCADHLDERRSVWSLL